MPESKVFAGARIRRLRKTLGLTQARMAEALDLSASYLNLLERDQRPVTARVLLRLADVFDVDLREFAVGSDQRLISGLSEASADPVLSGFALEPGELREWVERSPRTAEAFVRLHTAYRETLSDAAALIERRAGGEAAAAGSELPLEEVRDALNACDNHYPELEAIAERFVAGADLVDGEIFSALRRRAAEAYGVSVRVMPYDVMGEELRRFDRHSKRLFLSELLEPPARIFQIARQIGLIEAGEAIDEIVARAPLSSPEARRLYRVSLANYFAGAVMMPYEPFRAAAEAVRYDLDVLCRRFSASFEQAAHRVTTLRRPGAKGVAFFLVRTDAAGNVTKRFGGGVFPFARFGGACPRWRLFDAFRSPGRIAVQLVELPDGARFVSLSRTVRRPGLGARAGGGLLAVALGCSASEARRVVYADSLDLAGEDAAEPIGVTCRLCERPACAERAHPPLRHKLYIDETRRGLAPFTFRAE